MPEEVNRIVTDHLSDLLFVTEESGIQNLIHEGVPNEKIHFAGNTMIDSLLAFKAKADDFQSARQQIYRSAKMPSHVSLQVLQRSQDTGNRGQ